MARVRLVGLLAALAVGGTCGVAVGAPAAPFPLSGTPAVTKGGVGATPAQWVPGRVLVRFRQGLTRSEVLRALAARGARSARRLGAFGIDVVRLPPGLSVRRAVSLFRADPRVAEVEPDVYRYLDVPPNDTYGSHLWGLENTGQNHLISGGAETLLKRGRTDADMDVTEAWGQQLGRPSTIVAVVDSGVDVTHPDLAARLWRNPSEVADGDDDDQNGKIDDVHGWNFAGNNNDLLAPTGLEGFDHGTHVAGTIAAVRGNSTGVAGVCPGCRVMALRFMTDTGRLPLSAELRAIAYARTEGAKIMNASFAGPNWSNLEREAIRTSRLLVVAAAGNDSLDNDMELAAGPVSSPSYPAAYDLPNILTVAASNHRDEYGYFTGCVTVELHPKPECAFTNWGHDSVDVAAPGVDILSTVPAGSGDVGGDYEVFDGTSMATPHVAGVAGLVKSEHPGFWPSKVKNAIMRSVDHRVNLQRLPTLLFPTLRRGSFTRTNNGRVNADKALNASTLPFPKTDGNVRGAVPMQGRETGAVAWPADVNDVWKRFLRRGERYRIRLNGPPRRDFDLYVYKPRTKEIWQPFRRLRRGVGQTADETVTFTAPVAGVYFIQVSAWLAQRGHYVLTITRL